MRIKLTNNHEFTHKLTQKRYIHVETWLQQWQQQSLHNIIMYTTQATISISISCITHAWCVNIPSISYFVYFKEYWLVLWWLFFPIRVRYWLAFWCLWTDFFFKLEIIIFTTGLQFDLPWPSFKVTGAWDRQSQNYYTQRLTMFIVKLDQNVMLLGLAGIIRLVPI